MTFKLYVAAASIATFALVSCGGSNNADYVDKSLITPGSAKKDTVPAAVMQNTPATPGTVPVAVPGATPVAVPGASPVNIVPQNNTMQISPATTTATAPGMNPPHGQPGHRCDISVGAPLNSKPAPANVQPTTVSAQPAANPVTVTQVPTVTKTAPGMNPPHGEPGHRCDIAVGAPLDSKPTTPAATTATATQAPPLIMAPVKKDSAKN